MSDHDPTPPTEPGTGRQQNAAAQEADIRAAELRAEQARLAREQRAQERPAAANPLFEPDARQERAAPPDARQERAAPPDARQERAAPPVRVVRRGGTPVLLTLLLVAGLAGGLWWVWNNPKPLDQGDAGQQGSPVQQADLARVATLVAALSSQVQEQSGQVAQQSGAAAKQLAALTARVEKLEQAPAPAASAAPAAAPAVDPAEIGKQFDGLGARIDALAAKEQADLQAQQASQQAAAQQGASQAAAPAEITKQLDGLGAKLDALAAKEQSDLQAAQQAAQQVAQQAAQQAGQQAIQQAVQQAAQQQSQLPPPPASPETKQELLTLNQKLLEQKVQEEQTVKQQKAELIDQIGQGKSELTALQQRVDQLEHSAGAVQGEAGKTAREIRIQQAAVALAAGQPLGDVPDAPPELARFAAKAPPTEASLRAEFPHVAEAARAASRPDTDKRSFVDRALARMQQSVTVRRGDHVIVGDPAAGVLARAQEDVTNDDLQGAVHALSALHGPAADAVADWVAQVNALLAARAALASLSAHG